MSNLNYKKSNSTIVRNRDFMHDLSSGEFWFPMWGELFDLFLSGEMSPSKFKLLCLMMRHGSRFHVKRSYLRKFFDARTIKKYIVELVAEGYLTVENKNGKTIHHVNSIQDWKCFSHIDFTETNRKEQPSNKKQGHLDDNLSTSDEHFVEGVPQHGCSTTPVLHNTPLRRTNREGKKEKKKNETYRARTRDEPSVRSFSFPEDSAVSDTDVVNSEPVTVANDVNNEAQSKKPLLDKFNDTVADLKAKEPHTVKKKVIAPSEKDVPRFAKMDAGSSNLKINSEAKAYLQNGLKGLFEFSSKENHVKLFKLIYVAAELSGNPPKYIKAVVNRLRQLKQVMPEFEMTHQKFFEEFYDFNKVVLSEMD